MASEVAHPKRNIAKIGRTRPASIDYRQYFHVLGKPGEGLLQKQQGAAPACKCCRSEVLNFQVLRSIKMHEMAAAPLNLIALWAVAHAPAGYICLGVSNCSLMLSTNVSME